MKILPENSKHRSCLSRLYQLLACYNLGLNVKARFCAYNFEQNFDFETGSRKERRTITQ